MMPTDVTRGEMMVIIAVCVPLAVAAFLFALG
jgi:hypothetical protein